MARRPLWLWERLIAELEWMLLDAPRLGRCRRWIALRLLLALHRLVKPSLDEAKAGRP